MHKRLVVHPMFTMKTNSCLVVGVEQVVGINRCVCIAEEAPHALQVFVVKPLKAVLRHVLIGFYQCLGHDEVLYTVQSGIREMLSPHHPMCLHRLTHLQSRVHDNTVEAAQHLCIHTAHRGADDEVGVFFVAHLPQQCHCLFRFYGQVRSYHRRVGQNLTDTCYGARLSGRTEAVDIENLLPLHQFRELFDILVCLFHACKVNDKIRKN